MTISSITSVSVSVASSEGMSRFVPAPQTAPSFVTPREPAVADTVNQASSPERVRQAVNQVNDAFTQKEQNLYASLERDKSTGINVVKVLDKTTNEVISQFPSKEIIAIAEAIDQSQEDKGRLINVSA